MGATQLSNAVARGSKLAAVSSITICPTQACTTPRRASRYKPSVMRPRASVCVAQVLALQRVPHAQTEPELQSGDRSAPCLAPCTLCAVCAVAPVNPPPVHTVSVCVIGARVYSPKIPPHRPNNAPTFASRRTYTVITTVTTDMTRFCTSAIVPCLYRERAIG